VDIDQGETMSGAGVVWKADVAREFLTPERCHILETYNTPTEDSLSIARARVEPNVTTAWHVLEHTMERYIIAEGHGIVEVGDFPAADVGPGDVASFPRGPAKELPTRGASI
jgi:mannose-6-phosphate isomerase-like protein (cupin superfamily)